MHQFFFFTKLLHTSLHLHLLDWMDEAGENRDFFLLVVSVPNSKAYLLGVIECEYCTWFCESSLVSTGVVLTRVYLESVKGP